VDALVEDTSQTIVPARAVYLKACKLSDQTGSWTPICAGSCLGTALLLLIYI